MDDIDARLLDLLQRDSSVSNADLARRVGLSAAGVHKRVRRLEAQGTIRGYGARLDRQHLGLGLLSFITLKLDSNSLPSYQAVEAAVKAMPNVLECFEVTGNDDVLLKVAVRDMDHLRTFLHGLASELAPFSHVQTTVVLHELKVNGPLPIRDEPTEATDPDRDAVGDGSQEDGGTER